VERLSPRERRVDEVAAADAETRRMMQEAAHEMEPSFLSAEPPSRRDPVSDVESKVIDIGTDLRGDRARTEHELDGNGQSESFKARKGLLIALAVGLVLLLLWLGLRN
jgi:hypothetical protein